MIKVDGVDEEIQPHRVTPWRVLLLCVFVVAGFIVIATATTADGEDLRPEGGSLTTVLRESTDRLEADQRRLAELDDQVRNFANLGGDVAVLEQQNRVTALEEPTGLTEVQGRGIRVVLDDAPRDDPVPGLDLNALVVHQQDLQAFVNALWAGGAEAITLQGQRLMATTAIKCVGSTVVLHGVPYVPPYVIEAVGNPVSLQQALDSSPAVDLYGQYADRYGLGLEVEWRDSVTAQPYAGTVSLLYAQPIED